MQPLKITAHLASSIAISRPEDIALDGLLSYEVLRRHFGADFYTLPDPKEQLLFAALPLAMRGAHIEAATGDLFPTATCWYWACSSAIVDVKGRDRQYWNKRFDTAPALSDHIDFDGKREKVLIEQGRFKAYHMPLTTVVASAIVWYAYGDRDVIADILCPVAVIGKKRVQGNGRVLAWEIEPIAEDYSEWRDDTLMRPLPMPLVDVTAITPLDMQHIAYRAPQWHRANQCLCVVKARKSPITLA